MLFCSITHRLSPSILNYEIGPEQVLSDISYPEKWSPSALGK